MTPSAEITGYWDTIIVGAGAAGLMAAIESANRGRRVLVVDHANKVGKKILMSGGGRCNFTNIYSDPHDHFLSANPHFMKSALSRYTPWHFAGLVAKHGVPYHEKKLGQLFCDNTSKDIVRVLLDECAAAGARVVTHTSIESVDTGSPHRLGTKDGELRCEALIIATGGYSIPKMGASGFGYDLAASLGLALQPTRAALVPITLEDDELKRFKDLAGVSLDSETTAGSAGFRENVLFTHRGLSGPAILQASSYWQPGEALAIDLFPERDLRAYLHEQRREQPKLSLKNCLGADLTRRVAQRWCDLWLGDAPMASLSDAAIERVVDALQPWTVWPAGTEGYRTAEVTMGGVDTDELDSQTMECRRVSGLFFIGEVVDVTGHLGGHNFQWAWASGHAAGQVA